MRTRSILVRFPGHPFSPHALMPDRFAAVLAGALMSAGHETQVWDYGTVEMLDRLYPVRSREAARRLPAEAVDAVISSGSPAGVTALVRGMGRALDARQAEVCAVLGDELAAVPILDFAVFCVHSRSELAAARRIAWRIRARRANVRLLLAGPWADLYGEVLAESGGAQAFDGILMGDAEASVAELAARIHDPEAWKVVANVIAIAAGQTRLARKSRAFTLDAAPAPVYEASVYPALHTAVKLQLFTVEDSRGCSENCHACPLPESGQGRIRLRSVRSVCEEVSHLFRTLGARTFRFSGEGTPMFHAVSIAQALLTRRMGVRYTRPLQICYASPDAAAVLRESGCDSCSVRVDTGSQRLLDDYYARGFGVTHCEQVLRACVTEDIYTVARFTYPCPADDYHSRAETVRIVRRTQPHSAEIQLPELLPGSDWHAWAGDFGFRVDEKQRTRWLVHDGPGASRHGASASNRYFRIGSMAPKRVDRETALLMSEIAECGIPVNVSAETALIARVLGSGAEGEEAAFHRDFVRNLILGYTDRLAAKVMRFNRRANLAAEKVPMQRFASLRMAVGN